MNRREQEEAVRRARRIADTFAKLHAQLPTILARNAEPAGRDGYSAGRGGPGRTYDPRPTEATALARYEHGEMPDPFAELVVKLLAHLDQAGIEAAAVLLVLGKLERMSQRHTSNTLVCANPSCDHVITRATANDRPRRGRCRRCYEFLVAHDRDWTPRANRQGAA